MIQEGIIKKENIIAAEGYHVVELHESDLYKLRAGLSQEFVRAKVINSQSEYQNKWVGVGKSAIIEINKDENVYLVRDTAVLFEF